NITDLSSGGNSKINHIHGVTVYFFMYREYVDLVPTNLVYVLNKNSEIFLDIGNRIGNNAIKGEHWFTIAVFV
ncbi:hypothetical protein L9F63_000100, partial [Diploptera punctata]